MAMLKARRHVVGLYVLVAVLIIASVSHIASSKGKAFADSFQRWSKNDRLLWPESSDEPVSDEAASQSSLSSFEQLLGPESAITDLNSDHYFIIASNSTETGRYFRIQLGNYKAINPNIIPHPTRQDRWIVVAQHHDLEQDSDIHNWLTELVCTALLEDDVLRCEKQPVVLPIAATPTGRCEGDLAYLNLNIGPHDARVFWGPDRPYIIYGSTSTHNCFGQWIQDLRMMVPWTETPELLISYRYPTDLQRPPPYGIFEKNWFPFWDDQGRMYLHYDIWPNRVFAQLHEDGSVDSASMTEGSSADTHCLQRYLPDVSAAASESIHQATNSLSITLCKRADNDCIQTEDNTLIMTIVQHKKHYSLHSVYEPYVVLFRQATSFALYGISSKPLWIQGRKSPGERSGIPEDQSEMLYVTSINWKEPSRRYHGYLDDVIMMGFGIEDQATGGMDVLAEDLIASIGLCQG